LSSGSHQFSTSPVKMGCSRSCAQASAPERMHIRQSGQLLCSAEQQFSNDTLGSDVHVEEAATKKRRLSGDENDPGLAVEANVAVAAVCPQDTGKASKPFLDPVPIVPVKNTGSGKWCIRDVYEHQALKLGLRCLDELWGGEDIERFSRPLDSLLKEKLFRDLLSGNLQFHSVPAMGISAVQRDLRNLSVVQLLRLKCRMIEADSMKGSHGAFLSALDDILYTKLGMKATSGLQLSLSATEMHRCGVEAVLLVAAAGAIPTYDDWAWSIDDNHCVFFNTRRFTSSTVFPSSGVLEVCKARPTVEVTFEPGQVGWNLDHENRVLSIAPEQQAEKQGVKRGWLIRGIDDQPYTKELFQQKMAGTVPYKVKAIGVLEAYNPSGKQRGIDWQVQLVLKQADLADFAASCQTIQTPHRVHRKDVRRH